MTSKPVFFSILAAMLLLPAVQAEESPAAAAPAEPAAEPPNPTEERIRAYREQFDQRAKDAELLRQQHQAEMEEQRKRHQAEMEAVHQSARPAPSARLPKSVSRSRRPV